MKPPTSEKVVFGTGRITAERIRRGKQVGTRVLDSFLTPASYRYSDRSVGMRRMAETKSAQARVAATSNVLRGDFSKELEGGVRLETPTKDGGKIMATGNKYDEGREQRTVWSLSVESAKGRTSEFAIYVRERPDNGQRGQSSWVGLDVINPKTSELHNASSYVGEGEADANRTVAAALRQLHEARDNGSLIVRAMPVEAVDQPMPTAA